MAPTYGGVLQWARDNLLEKVLAVEGSDYHSVGVIHAEVDPDNHNILVVLTTTNLLKNLLRTTGSITGGFIATDGSHSVNWNGIPVLPVGTVSNVNFLVLMLSPLICM